jgi:hypothetical protein
VIEEEDIAAVSVDTVHRLHWEVLETPSLWGKLNLQVIVRRIIPRGDSSGLSVQRIHSWSRSAPSLNILLVVARDTRKNAATYDDVRSQPGFPKLTDNQKTIENPWIVFQVEC